MLALRVGYWSSSAIARIMVGCAPLPAMSFMSDKAFVDTNILVYAHDLVPGVKHDRARELIEKLWTAGGGVLSTQVLQELCVNLRRKTTRPCTVEETRILLENYADWQIVNNTLDSIVGALSIEVRYRISFWEALVLQAAERGGATILYSEGLSDGQTYGSVRVINPLKELASH